MKRHFIFVVLAAALAASTASAQWLEKTVYLPDSLSGVYQPRCLAYNSVNNTVYVGGYSGYCLVAFDAASNEKVARIPVGFDVLDLCYNPQNNELYCVSFLTPAVTVVDGATNRVLRQIPVNPGPGALLLNTQMNKLYCQAENSGMMDVIDCRTDTVIKTLRTDSDFIGACLAPSLDKLYVLSGGAYTSSLTVIDCSTDSVLVRFEDIGHAPQGLCYNPRRNKLCCSFRDPYSFNVTIFDCTADTVLAVVETSDPLEPTAGVCYNSREDKVYLALYHSVTEYNMYVIDGAGDSVSSRVHMDDWWEPELCYDSIQNRLYKWERGQSGIYIVDAGPDTIIRFEPMKSESRRARFVPEVNRLYIGGWPAEVGVLDGSLGVVTDVIILGSDPTDVCYFAGTDRLFCSETWIDAVSILSGSTHEVVRRLLIGSNPGDLCLIPEAGRLYCALHREAGEIAVIDCAAESVVAMVSPLSEPRQLCYSLRLDRLFCAGTNSVVFIDLASNQIINQVITDGDPLLLTLDAGGRRLYCVLPQVGSTPCRVIVIDAETGALLREVVLSSSPPTALCVNPRDNKVYCALDRGDAVAVFDAAGDSLLCRIPLGGRPSQLCYNPVNNCVYCATAEDSMVHVIDGASNRIIASVRVRGRPWVLSLDSIANRLACFTDSWALGVANFIDCRSNLLAAQFDLPNLATSTRWVRDQRRTYVTSRSGSCIMVLRDTTVSGIAQGPPRGASGHVSATIVRGVLCMPAANGERRLASGVLLDISGRHAMLLMPGPNDVRHLAPGVYFVREQASGAGDQAAVTVRRVVIAR